MNIPSEEELGRMIEEKYAITEEDWRKQINDAVGYMKIVVGTRSEDVMPQLVVHVVDEKGERSMRIYAIAMPFNSPEEKREALYSIGQRLYPERLMPVTAFLISEAWMASESPAGDQANKKECVTIAGFGMVPRRTMISTTLVRRDEKKHIHLEGETQIHDGGKPYLLMQFYKGFFSYAIAARQAEGKTFHE